MVQRVHHRSRALAQQDDGEQAEALGQVLRVRPYRPASLLVVFNGLRLLNGSRTFA
jgi:hypothetical protein